MLYAFAASVFTIVGLTGLGSAALVMVPARPPILYVGSRHFHDIMVGRRLMGYLGGMHYCGRK